MVSRGVCVWTRGQSYEEVSDDVGILQIALMESTIRNITVIMWPLTVLTSRLWMVIHSAFYLLHCVTVTAV